jgi:hypothetical protein
VGDSAQSSVVDDDPALWKDVTLGRGRMVSLLPNPNFDTKVLVSLYGEIVTFLGF